MTNLEIGLSIATGLGFLLAGLFLHVLVYWYRKYEFVSESVIVLHETFIKIESAGSPEEIEAARQKGGEKLNKLLMRSQ